MELENKVMKLYEDILEPVKARKIVLMLKYVIVDRETELDRLKREIPISEESIKKYVDNDSLMLKYLTEEELKVFRQKMDKILDKNNKLRKLINLVLVKNITDIDKLQKTIPISMETLRKYISDKGLLSKYLTEAEIKLFLERLQRVNPKLQRLVKVVMIDGVTDLDQIEKQAGIKIATIQKHLDNPVELNEYLTEQELKVFDSILREHLNEREHREENLEISIVRKIIDDILNTRYRYRDICSNNFPSWKKFEEYFHDEEFMAKHFPKGTHERVKEKIKENDSLRKKVPRDCFIIEDRFCIMITKKDIHYLNQYDTKRLNFVSEYLGTGANLNYVVEKNGISLLETLTLLSSPKLKEMLDEKYYIILKQCLRIENLLLGNELQKKKEFILEVINFLEQNNFDTKLAMVYFGIPEPLFNKVLQEILKLQYASEDTKNTIKSILNIEKEVKQK